MRRQWEKREVRHFSTTTQQETIENSWSQTVQTTKLGLQTGQDFTHHLPPEPTTSTVRSNRNFNFRFAKRRNGSPDRHYFRVASNPVSRKFAYEFRFAKPPYFSPFSVLLGTFLFSNKVAHGVKEVFLLTNTWLVCKRDEAALIIMSVSVLSQTDLTMMCPAQQIKRAKQRKHDLFVFAALGFYLQKIFCWAKKMLTGLDKR